MSLDNPPLKDLNSIIPKLMVPTTTTPPPKLVRSSRARFVAAGFCITLAMITYFDRACIGVLSSLISVDLGLTMKQMGVVFSVFTIAYGVFGIPSAWWGEKVGSRIALTGIVGWWSLFTAFTGGTFGFASLLAVRFCFGAGEAGAWPNAMRVISRWIPSIEHGRVQGLFFAGAHFAAGITPILVLLLLEPLLGWRGVFIFFGLFGGAWVIAWIKWFRDRPEDHPRVNAAELAIITKDRIDLDEHHRGAGRVWATVLSNPNLWLLSLCVFCNSYGFYFVITWLPTFLHSLPLSQTALAFYSGLPMFLSIPADILGGISTDWLSKRFGLRLGRAIVGGLSFAMATAAMLLAVYSESAHFTAIFLGLSIGASMFGIPPTFAVCIEIGGAHAGLSTAVMNTMGQVGATLCPLVMAYLVGHSGHSSDWTLPLQTIIFLYSIAGLSWVFINPNKKVQVA